LLTFNKDFPRIGLRLEPSCKKAAVAFTNKKSAENSAGKEAHPKKCFRERLVREVGKRLRWFGSLNSSQLQKGYTYLAFTLESEPSIDSPQLAAHTRILLLTR
jgi:hypothetical protein